MSIQYLLHFILLYHSLTRYFWIALGRIQCHITRLIFAALFVRWLELRVSLIEVVVTGYSIIVAFCLARLLDGILPGTKRSSRYWVHFVWIINKIFNVLITYWVTWSYSADELSFIQFLITLFPAIIIYLQCDALVTKQPEQVQSWRDHYYEVSKYFFGMNIALAIGLAIQAFFAGSDDFPHMIYVMLCVLVALSFVGYCAMTHKVHRIIAILAMLNLGVIVPTYLSLGAPA